MQYFLVTCVESLASFNKYESKDNRLLFGRDMANSIRSPNHLSSRDFFISKQTIRLKLCRFMNVICVQDKLPNNYAEYEWSTNQSRESKNQT